MTHTLLVNDDCTWKLFICGHEVKPITDGPLNAVPVTLNQESFINLISIIDQCKVCPGNPDTHFIELKCVLEILIHILFYFFKLDTKIVEGSGISILSERNQRVGLRHSFPCCYYCVDSFENSLLLRGNVAASRHT